MAVKEMLIVFIYDLEYCQNEDDDPLKAIKYFHPSWVSEQQKLALCGQLVGMLNFCSDFEEVDCISLKNGKFKIEQFGRFVMAIGTDRNIQESLLNHRAELMKKILRLYHNDINDIFENFSDSKNFSDKLYHVFETYLPTLQYNSNHLQNIYKLYLPKSASNLFLDATQILENAACKPNVLGGVILYNNKVISTQLSIDLTKILVATDPVRIKPTSEVTKNVDFHIPFGTQIIKIHISLNEYQKLQQIKSKMSEATSLGVQNTLPLPFSIKKKNKESSSLMKRDKSLIFTNIPEEEALIEIPSPVEKIRTNRPNHLPLKLKTIPPESGIASIVSFDESDSYPDFIGKASIASTPMTENKILAGPIQSIFAKSTETTQSLFDEVNAIEMKPLIKQKPKDIPKEWENVYIAFAHNPFKSQSQWKKKSWDDLRIDDDENDNISSYKVYDTITDPIYPIFSDKKMPISKTLFDDFQTLHNPNVNELKPLPIEEKNLMKLKSLPQKIFEADPMIMKRSDIKNSPNRIMRNQKKKLLKLPIKPCLDLVDSGKPSTSKAAIAADNNTSIFDSPSTKTKKNMGGLQLTPLMSKLTLLAMNENENFSSGFSSFDLPTPNYYDTPTDNTNRTLFNRLSKVDEEKHDENTANEDNEHSNEMKRVDLLVIGHQNMTLMVIADENLCDELMVQQMFEICVNRLTRLESKLNEVINVTVDLKASEYSFITFDHNWNVLQRSGAFDQQTAILIHDNFTANKNISDVIVRTNDSLIYGHNSGGLEVFYQHPAKQQNDVLVSEASETEMPKSNLCCEIMMKLCFK
ncbi:uncharacterized protein HPS4 [Chironomus tepperi]|uniref:uncharacterized protein HPS4 n=1 Tax=Chironomus tepperi TaxID=113505 RepID=UPI00391EF956